MNQRANIDDLLQPAAPATSPVRRIEVWDLPTRVFHWSLVLAVTVAIVTGELGGDWMVWHGRAGISIAALLVFRLVWGMVGGSYARFRQFFPTITTVRAYLRGEWQQAGHNPLGALSVLALLALLSAQVLSGLFGNDEIAFYGPWAATISEDWSNRVTGWHQLLANGLFVLLALHVGAILAYLLIRKDNLVKPMLRGWKEASHGVAALPATRAALFLALLLALLAALFASGTVRW